MKQAFWLTMESLMGKKINMHTHTSRCKHAIGEDREYVENAIEAGFEVLGFSDHTPFHFENGFVSPIRMDVGELEGYVRSVEKLREEYKKDITIYCGLEMEYFPNRFHQTIDMVRQYPMDYLILGQHFFDDESRPARVIWARSEEFYLEHYVDLVMEGLSNDCFLYAAHPDVVNFTGPQEIYEKHMLRLLQELKKRNMPIEINVNGYIEGIHYPSSRLVELGVRNGNTFHVGVDAHFPSALVDQFSYESCKAMVTEQGGKLVCCK